MRALNKITLAAGAAALLLAAGQPALRADPIYGTISFDGVATTNTGNLANATAFTDIWAIVIPEETGDYSGVPVGTDVTFTPFSFSDSSVTPLWTFTIGSVTYSFEATSITVDVQNSTFLDVSGVGTADITGYDPTPGVWSITDTSTGGSPVFTFGSADSVPDATSTAALIAVGCVILAAGVLIRRGRQSPAL